MEQWTALVDRHLDAMGLFACVIELGSFSKASARLGMPKSTLSRRISQLEQRLNARLLHRTTRQLKLTEVGKLYFEYCRRMLDEAQQAQLLVQKLQAQPSGLLRVAMPLAFGTEFIQQLLQDFLATYPEVDLELRLENRNVDLIDEEVDLAFRVGDILPDSNLIARDIGTARMLLCAAPEYVRRQGGLPRTPEELNLQDLILHPASPRHLKSAQGSLQLPPAGRLRINDMGLIYQMTLRGAGVGMVPVMFAAADIAAGRLLQVLPDYEFVDKRFYLVYPSRRLQAAKVMAFLDFVLSRVRPTPPWAVAIDAGAGTLRPIPHQQC